MKTILALFFLLTFLSFPAVSQQSKWLPVEGPPSFRPQKIYGFPNGMLYLYSKLRDYSKHESDTAWKPGALSTRPGIKKIIYGENGLLYFVATGLWAFEKAFRSTNYGTTWEEINYPGYDFVLNPETGILTSLHYDQIRASSTDGGTTWRETTLPFHPSEGPWLGPKNQIYATGWEGNGGRITLYMSTDDGATWVEDSTNADDWQYETLTRVSPTTAIISYRGESIYYTKDNGNNWRFVADFPHVGSPMYGTWVPCGKTVFLNAGLEIYALDTLTWTLKKPKQPDSTFFLPFAKGASNKVYTATFYSGFMDSAYGEADTDVYMITEEADSLYPFHKGIYPEAGSQILALDSATLLYKGISIHLSKDGGQTWQQIPRKVSISYNEDDRYEKCVPCGRNGSVYTADHYGPANDAIIKINAKDGAWERIPTEGTSIRLFCGGNERLYRLDMTSGKFSFTDDDGATWTDIPNAVFLGIGTQKFIVTDNGTILVLTGSSVQRFDPVTGLWELIPFPNNFPWTEQEVSRLERSKSDVLYAIAGHYPKLYTSNDDGKTWKLQEDLYAIGYYSPLPDLLFDEQNSVYLVSPSGEIRKSTNGGETWTGPLGDWIRFEHKDIPTGFTSVCVDPAGYFWGVSWMDGIYRFDRSLDVKPSPRSPTASSLSIYPNPAVNTGTVTASITLEQIPPSPLHIEVVNELGAVVHSQQVESNGQRVSATVPVSGLTNGYYIVRAIGNDRTLQQGLAVWGK